MARVLSPTSKTSTSRLSPGLCGTAGEYFVAAELSRRGYVASITLRNARGIDILASDADAKRSVGIQVKTAQNGSKEWMLNKKAEQDLADNLFYVFVNLSPGKSPEYHVVPRDVVSKVVRESHATWLKTPGRRGREHVDNPMRKFSDRTGKYQDRWDLLGLDA
jgi:hypothetical protein